MGRYARRDVSGLLLVVCVESIRDSTCRDENPRDEIFVRPFMLQWVVPDFTFPPPRPAVRQSKGRILENNTISTDSTPKINSSMPRVQVHKQAYQDQISLRTCRIEC